MNRKKDAEMTPAERKMAKEEYLANKPPVKGKGMCGFGSSRWQGLPQKLTDKTKCFNSIWLNIKEEAMKPGYK